MTTRTKADYCFRTPYANEREAAAKIAQILRGRARNKDNKVTSTRVYEVSGPCERCTLYHITSRNGRG